MKTILFAAIATLALASTAPAFADAAHRGTAAVGARGDARSNANNGPAAKDILAAVDAQDMSRIAPRIALSDSVAVAWRSSP
jgi:hypothetical protein